MPRHIPARNANTGPSPIHQAVWSLQPRLCFLAQRKPLAPLSLQRPRKYHLGSFKISTLFLKHRYRRPPIGPSSQNPWQERVSISWHQFTSLTDTRELGARSEASRSSTPYPNIYSRSGYDMMGILVGHGFMILLFRYFSSI